ncbi:MAG: hypothetical protein FJ387_25040 [Verrucomicrobia bacterium]|nr:hypothetical protein [Verrucomicrobiota bacterium]
MMRNQSGRRRTAGRGGREGVASSRPNGYPAAMLRWRRSSDAPRGAPSTARRSRCLHPRIRGALRSRAPLLYRPRSGSPWPNYAVPGLACIVGWGMAMGTAFAQPLPQGDEPPLYGDATTREVAVGDAHEFVFRLWQRGEGFTDTAALSMLQSQQGYLWFGTRTGLVRYDGIRFALFNRANTPAMALDYCQSLAEDRQGALWIGTPDGLLRHQGPDWSWHPVRGSPPAWNVWTVCATRDGAVWAGTDYGLFRLESGHLVKITDPDELTRGAVLALHEDTDGALWVGSHRGLWRRDPQTGRFSDSVQPLNGPPYVLCGVFRDPVGRLWTASARGVSDFAATVSYQQTGRAGWVAPERWVHAFRPLNWAGEADGTVWVPYAHAGVVRLSPAPATLFGLPAWAFGSQTATAMCRDHEGTFWLGHGHPHGLASLTPRRFQVTAKADGLAHDIGWSVCEARDGTVWVGTDGGLSALRNGQWTSLTQTNGLARNEVRAVVEDIAGTLWVGTLNGLDSIREGQFTNHRFPGEWFETKIRALLPARDGGVWVGTVRGLIHYHQGQLTKYTTADGLGAQEVRALLEDRAGHLWVGTLGGGLSCLRENKSTTLTTTKGLPSDQVWALVEDAEGALWIGTDRGLGRLKDGRLRTFRPADGLPADLVNTLLVDDFGRLWVGHDAGIYWVPIREFEDLAAGRATAVQPVRYTQADGLLTTEVNGQKSFPAACKSRDGRLWFPTAKGVAVIDPARVQPDTVPPVVAIEQIRADGEVLLDTDPGGKFVGANLTWTPAAAAADEKPAAVRVPEGASDGAQPPAVAARRLGLRLPPGRGRILQIRYTAGLFIAPEQARFRYRLHGLQDRWIEAGGRREVEFTNLRPGRYEFEVIACGHHGVWPERGTRLAVALAPFFYQTGWFYGACALGLVGVVGGIVQWRVRGLRRQQRQQEQAAIAAERTRIAKDLHDGLGADLNRLSLLAELQTSVKGLFGPGEKRRFRSRE